MKLLPGRFRRAPSDLMIAPVRSAPPGRIDDEVQKTDEEATHRKAAAQRPSFSRWSDG